MLVKHRHGGFKYRLIGGSMAASWDGVVVNGVTGEFGIAGGAWQGCGACGYNDRGADG